MNKHRVPVLIFLLFLLPGFILSQENPDQKNSSEKYFSIKLTAAYLEEFNNSKFLDNLKITSVSELGKEGVSMVETRPNKIFPGLEFNVYTPRESYYGSTFGISYLFSEIYCNYSNSEKTDISTGHFFRAKSHGPIMLNSHRIKFLYGLNFNTKFGFSFFIQPLNLEIRQVLKGSSNIQTDTYEIYSYRIPQPYYSYFPDSTSTYVSTKRGDYSYANRLTLAFPTTLGFEQKFRIKNLNYLAGLCGSFSVLEKYFAIRLFLGICFGPGTSKK